MSLDTPVQCTSTEFYLYVILSTGATPESGVKYCVLCTMYYVLCTVT